MLHSVWIISFTLLLITFCICGSEAQQVQEDTQYFNVSKPAPNTPYVTGQKLPLVYRISADSTTSTLQLSITLQDVRNATNTVVMVQNANIAKGFSEQVNQGGVIVYEHQENYDIPLTAAPGSYNVVYNNRATTQNVTIPITIATATTARPAAPSSSATGSKKVIWDSSAINQCTFMPSSWSILCLSALVAFIL